MRKTLKSYRLDSDTLRLISSLARRRRCTNTEVITRAVRDMAERRRAGRGKTPPNPKVEA
jgi:predicted transcriptional regulator